MPRSAMPAALAVVGLAAILAAACDDGGGGPRRTINITQTNDSCTPAAIDLQTGEKVTFEVKNEGSKGKEVEGIEGTKLEELLVPEGRTRSVDYTAPKDPGTRKIKCYVPGGSSTIIELHVSGDSTSRDEDTGDAGDGSPFETTKAAKATVRSDLAEYTVHPDVASVPGGPIRFVANNKSTDEVHELAVLQVKEDGSFVNTGEIEDLDPGQSGELVLDLPAGKYVLACLIVPGQAGSTTDHYKAGMYTSFTVS